MDGFLMFWGLGLKETYIYIQADNDDWPTCNLCIMGKDVYQQTGMNKPSGGSVGFSGP